MAPAPKRRKTSSSATFKFKGNKQPIEELKFDPDARQEYLTGFHKRKLQRIKHAQEDAAKQAKIEKVEARKEMREERKKDVERHVQEVNALMMQNNPDISDDEAMGENEEWDGITEEASASAPANPDGVDEYVDEDKFTTVTIETMDADPRKWDGEGSDAEKEEEVAVVKEGQEAEAEDGAAAGKKRVWTKEKPQKSEADKAARKKKKAFRYESKFERQQGRNKIKAKNKASATARKDAEKSAPRRKGPTKTARNAHKNKQN